MNGLASRFAVCVQLVALVSCETYSVRVSTDTHINEVSDTFLSFSVDPKYLFSPEYRHSSKECVCMASSLKPAYIRIAGPSTASLTFHDAAMSINPVLENTQGQGLTVTSDQWQRFARWAKKSGFQLVFALNPDEETAAGMWDANTALNILTVADKTKIDDIVWQLGYECSNRSVEQYLNDMETLKVIVETFPGGEARRWRVVGGDVTNCLQADSRSDYKDYITLSDEKMDAILFNGNSSAHEFEKMTEDERHQLLRMLALSETPLWITEKIRDDTSELERAVDWMFSLGHSAKNGFSVHFRELRSDEVYEPTLSFYMALLFKNLVGERVLDVKVKTVTNNTSLFAHCTSLRHKPVPGAVTLYGANMDNEPARFSIKLSRIEEGGDIMQFILGHDDNGNIVVNNRAMYYKGDIRPIVKRVRPYKTLLINLPPKSFGFWVLANTKVEACYDVGTKINGKKFLEAIPVTDISDRLKLGSLRKRGKRVALIEKSTSEEAINFLDFTNDVSKNIFNYDNVEKKLNGSNKETNDVHKRVESLNNNLKQTYDLLDKINRTKRQIGDRRKFNQNMIDSEVTERKTHKRKSKKDTMDRPSRTQKKIKNTSQNRKRLLEKIEQLNSKLNYTRNQRLNRLNKKNNPKRNITKRLVAKQSDTINKKMQSIENTLINEKVNNRTRRDIDETSKANEISNKIDYDDDYDKHTLHKVIRELKKTVNKLPVVFKEEYQEDSDNNHESNNAIEEELVVKTKITDDDASIRVSEKSNKPGVLKTTIDNLKSILGDVTDKTDKIWKVFNVLEFL